ncbi:patatin-like phospholipase family protein [Marinivivus vitaminiproducens]|uniref:patatin-like phospholipase family protein n=1 Tax=Marinivivus vitaminiproducens TaxID=3035935 RepID=UPI00279C99A1|nr:patatin-like phospholipase family protein [Geminicoccaceae bacterium SCSIO 64248]
MDAKPEAAPGDISAAKERARTGTRTKAAPCPEGKKRISLALQGGGAHGAFTWGVLDRLLEDDRLQIEAVCGTSAGAMNAVALVYGMAIGGHDGGRAALEQFWHKVGATARTSPVQPSWLDRLLSQGNMDYSLSWLFYDSLSRVSSPYQFNPLNLNPLRDLLVESIDFDVIRRCENIRLFLCATNVLTGRIKVFETPEITADHVLASACLPDIFQAIEIGGEFFWDGGYMGNPPIYPLIYRAETSDVLIVQINPIRIEKLPRTAREIADRVNTLSFNSSLMREMRAIHFVGRLLENGLLDTSRYKKLNVHTVSAEAEMAKLHASSKLNSDPGFLDYLFELGRGRAEAFLHEHFAAIGHRSSTDIVETFL